MHILPTQCNFGLMGNQEELKGKLICYPVFSCPSLTMFWLVWEDTWVRKYMITSLGGLFFCIWINFGSNRKHASWSATGVPFSHWQHAHFVLTQLLTKLLCIVGPLELVLLEHHQSYMQMSWQRTLDANTAHIFFTPWISLPNHKFKKTQNL